jgi:hypothetical protein
MLYGVETAASFICYISFRRFHGAFITVYIYIYILLLLGTYISTYYVFMYVYGEAVIAEFKRDRGSNNRIFYT